MKLIKYFLIVFALAWIGWGVFLMSEKMMDASLKGPSADEFTARAAGRMFVEQQLRSPSTAQFSSETATRRNGAWTVQGQVDAQNAFGVFLRSVYSCSVVFVVDHYESNNLATVAADGTDMGTGKACKIQ